MYIKPTNGKLLYCVYFLFLFIFIKETVVLQSGYKKKKMESFSPFFPGGCLPSFPYQIPTELFESINNKHTNIKIYLYNFPLTFFCRLRLVVFKTFFFLSLYLPLSFSISLMFLRTRKFACFFVFSSYIFFFFVSGEGGGFAR